MSGSETQAEQDRLSRLYGEMSDGELIALSESRGDLTEMAQGALLAEVRRRELQLPERLPELGDLGQGAGAEAMEWKTLHVFSQTFEARAAIAILEREGIEFALEDRTLDEQGAPRPGPAVALALMVVGADWSRAVAVLRRDAGLFPEAVVDPRGEVDDPAAEEQRFVVGDFATDEELAEAKTALRGAGIRFEVVREEGESGPGGSIEVEEAKVDQALAVLERLITDTAE